MPERLPHSFSGRVITSYSIHYTKLYDSEGDLGWQRDRFRRHIAAAKQSGKPLIIHSRDAKEDTLAILAEEGASEAGGVMHCFTGDWA